MVHAARRRWSGSTTGILGEDEQLTNAMKPMPAKPRIIIAHVEGAGAEGLSRGADYRNIVYYLPRPVYK